MYTVICIKRQAPIRPKEDQGPLWNDQRLHLKYRPEDLGFSEFGKLACSPDSRCLSHPESQGIFLLRVIQYRITQEKLSQASIIGVFITSSTCILSWSNSGYLKKKMCIFLKAVPQTALCMNSFSGVQYKMAFLKPFSFFSVSYIMSSLSIQFQRKRNIH